MPSTGPRRRRGRDTRGEGRGGRGRGGTRRGGGTGVRMCPLGGRRRGGGGGGRGGRRRAARGRGRPFLRGWLSCAGNRPWRGGEEGRVTLELKDLSSSRGDLQLTSITAALYPSSCSVLLISAPTHAPFFRTHQRRARSTCSPSVLFPPSHVHLAERYRPHAPEYVPLFPPAGASPSREHLSVFSPLRSEQPISSSYHVRRDLFQH